MPEIIGDAALYQNPLDAAAQTYASTPPAEGAGGAMGAVIEQGPAAYLARAAERGAYAGSGWFDRSLAIEGMGEAGLPVTPIETPTISAEEANALAPEGTTITDKPITHRLAVTGDCRPSADWKT